MPAETRGIAERVAQTKQNVETGNWKLETSSFDF